MAIAAPHIMSDRAHSHASEARSWFALRAAVLSDIGLVRRENQDCAAAVTAQGIFVVCDGMGGAAAGRVASELAVHTFLEQVSTIESTTDSRDGTSARPRLEQAIDAANGAVFSRAQREAKLHGMGTTLVAALVELEPDADGARSVWIGHVGDSRCYLYRNDRLLQLTRDHSLVQEQIEAGLLLPEDAELSPVRSVITRAVGTQPQVPADLAEHTLLPGDILMLASDGLTRELADREIAAILAASHADLDRGCQTLVDAALQHGGNDNVTVLLVASGALDPSAFS